MSATILSKTLTGRGERAFGLGDEVFTTGQVAKFCRVSSRCVSKWFDSGELKGYRLPMSEDRRVPRAELVRFMQHHQFPLPPELTGSRIAVAVLAPVAGCVSPLAAGLALARGECSRLLVGCLAGLDSAVQIAREVKEVCPALPVAILLADDRHPRDVPPLLFDAIFDGLTMPAAAAWAAG